MFWVSKVLAPAALVLGLVGAAVVTAAPDGNQPPFGGKGQFGKGGKKADEKVEQKKADEKKKVEDKKGPPPAPKSDAVVDAWLKVLLEKITDPHDTVRDSARGAIVAVGPAALPALQKLADGDDPAKAVAARKLIHAIHGHHPAHADHPGHPGFGGGMRGPGFSGGPGAGPMGQRGLGGSGGQRGMGPGGPGGRGGFPGGPGSGAGWSRSGRLRWARWLPGYGAGRSRRVPR